ncbi:MAG: hypothetical protein M3P11_05835 [Actinomycetota bacterium]|nr:hypothetical protein [Actinomycetota bacterium]
MTTRRGSTQTLRKDADGWAQTSSRGVVRRATAEQVWWHILPVIAFGSRRGVTLAVEPAATGEKG